MMLTRRGEPRFPAVWSTSWATRRTSELQHLRLGWLLRGIEPATGVRRETTRRLPEESRDVLQAPQGGGWDPRSGGPWQSNSGQRAERTTSGAGWGCRPNRSARRRPAPVAAPSASGSKGVRRKIAEAGGDTGVLPG